MPAPDQSLVPCPACAAVLPVPTQQLGKKIRCGKCSEIFITPAPASQPAAMEDDNPFAIPASTRPSRDDEEEADERPKARAKPEKTGPSVGVLIGAAALGLVLLGGTVFGIIYALKDKEPAKTVETPSKGKEPAKPKEKEKEKKLIEPALGPDGKMLDATRERVKGSTVYIRTILDQKRLGTGTGFFTAAPGYVITNAHVIGQTMEKVEKYKEIQVVIDSGLPNQRRLPATLLKADRELDLALLKVDVPAPVPPLLEVIDAYKLKETQEVYIFGFPGGESLGTNISVNISTISSVRRDGERIPWVQVAGGMHPGNSGGPVTDAAGRVIGVSRAIIVGSPINMAIPGDIVHSFLNNAGDLLPKK
jgi:S1-C subfamily serine protease